MNHVIFVGQGPGKDAAPYCPLEGHNAVRLGRLLDISASDFILDFARINLNSEWIGKAGKGDVFDAAEGRRAAAVLLQGSWSHYVLLGKNVAKCFDVKDEFLSTICHGRKHFFVLPHPSGINRWWNEPKNIASAEQELCRFLGVLT